MEYNQFYLNVEGYKEAERNIGDIAIPVFYLNVEGYKVVRFFLGNPISNTFYLNVEGYKEELGDDTVETVTCFI